MTPRFFKTPAEFNRWLAKNHQKADELWVGYYKKGTGKPSMTWPESVEEALCYGWIDGLRKSIDEKSYMIRFTPRKPTSNWSAVNIRTVKRLIQENRMKEPGLQAYRRRDPAKPAVYSFENRKVLAPAYKSRLKANTAAWAFFQSQPPWYRRTAGHWVMDAKREETRLKRLRQLIEDSAAGRTIKPLTRKTGSK